MKDMDTANVICETKMIKTYEGIVLTYSHYIETVLKRFSVHDLIHINTPVDVNLQLDKNMENHIMIEIFKV